MAEGGMFPPPCLGTGAETHTYVIRHGLVGLARVYTRSSVTFHYLQPLYSVQFVLQQIEDGLFRTLVYVLLIQV